MHTDKTYPIQIRVYLRPSAAIPLVLVAEKTISRRYTPIFEKFLKNPCESVSIRGHWSAPKF